jgi:hypothetical protein
VFVLARAAAPGPVLPALHQAGPHRIVEHVFDRRGELPLVPDDARPEALGEKRPEAPMARVVLACVVAVEPLQRARDLLRWPFDHEVVVRRHQAPGLEPEPEAPHGGSEVDQEQAPVDVVAEERRGEDAAGPDVEIPVRKTRPKNTPHPSILTNRGGKTTTRATSFPLPTRLREPRPVSDTRRGSSRQGCASRGECQTLVMAPAAVSLTG